MKKPDQPIFDLNDQFDTIVTIGEKVLPIQVKRFSRAEQEAFEKNWATFVEPRGTTELTLTDEERADRETRMRQFFEDTLRDAITVDEGYLRSRGKWVTDGAGVIEMFHARKDILGAFLAQVYLQNKLTDITRKNSSSPRDSGPGSDLSSQTRGGDAPDSTAGRVESSSTAVNDSVTGAIDQPSAASDATAQQAPELSGVKVH